MEAEISKSCEPWKIEVEIEILTLEIAIDKPQLRLFAQK
jgi:hypothetical protein